MLARGSRLAISRLRSAARSAPPLSDGTRSSATGWSLAALSAIAGAAPGLPAIAAYAHSGDVALLERIPFGRALARWLAGSGADLTFVSEDLQRRFGRAGRPARVGRCRSRSNADAAALPSGHRGPTRARPPAAGSAFLERPTGARPSGVWFPSRDSICWVDARTSPADVPTAADGHVEFVDPGRRSRGGRSVLARALRRTPACRACGCPDLVPARSGASGLARGLADLYGCSPRAFCPVGPHGEGSLPVATSGSAWRGRAADDRVAHRAAWPSSARDARPASAFFPAGVAERAAPGLGRCRTALRAPLPRPGSLPPAAQAGPSRIRSDAFHRSSVRRQSGRGLSAGDAAPRIAHTGDRRREQHQTAFFPAAVTRSRCAGSRRRWRSISPATPRWRRRSC